MMNYCTVETILAMDGIFSTQSSNWHIVVYLIWFKNIAVEGMPWQSSG